MSARLNQTHLAQLPSGPADVSAMDEENPPGPAELLPLAEDWQLAMEKTDLGTPNSLDGYTEIWVNIGIESTMFINKI